MSIFEQTREGIGMNKTLSVTIEQLSDNRSCMKINGVTIAVNGSPHPRYKGIPKIEEFVASTWALANNLLTKVDQSHDEAFTIRF